jgi:gentisate 1,2-dioxygenase
MSDAAEIELAPGFRDAMRKNSVAPLWEFLQAALPYGRPASRTRPHCWTYSEIKPLLLHAANTVPVERAERRVLILSDPARGPNAMQATGSIYGGLQILMPGEVAAGHRHTPSAARIVIEGTGAVTVVNGRTCPMERGDLILTPSMHWHSHHHSGSVPITWLDCLDLPAFTAMDSAFAEADQPMNIETEVALDLLNIGLAERSAILEPPDPYPMLRYGWKETRAALLRLMQQSGERLQVELRYVNPRTGGDALPIMGFSAIALPAGSVVSPRRRSSSRLFHVVEGRGCSSIDDFVFDWSSGDTFSAPTYAYIEHRTETDTTALLICTDDEPMQRRLGFFAEVD